MHAHMRLFANLIPDLPEGVDIVKVGMAGREDFEFIGGRIEKGPRSNAQVIVKPQKGYDFVFDIERNCYAVQKVEVEPAPAADPKNN